MQLVVITYTCTWQTITIKYYFLVWLYFFIEWNGHTSYSRILAAVVGCNNIADHACSSRAFHHRQTCIAQTKSLQYSLKFWGAKWSDGGGVRKRLHIGLGTQIHQSLESPMLRERERETRREDVRQLHIASVYMYTGILLCQVKIFLLLAIRQV